MALQLQNQFEGETEPFIAEPRFDLHPDGLLRRVGCTCTAFKQNGEHGFGGHMNT